VIPFVIEVLKKLIFKTHFFIVVCLVKTVIENISQKTTNYKCLFKSMDEVDKLQ